MGSKFSAEDVTVGALVGGCVGGALGASVGGSLGAIGGASVGASAGASVGSSGSASSESSAPTSSGSSGSASSDSKSYSSSSAWNDVLNRKVLSNSSWYEKIEKKLQNCGLITDEMNEDDRKKLILSLGEKGLFKETYLKLNTDYNESILKKLNDEITLMDDLPEGLRGDITNDEKAAYVHQILKFRRDARNFDVRMFLSKINGVRPRKLLFFSEFGTVHAGLEIDGVTLEWGRESLVIPNTNIRSMLVYTRLNFEKIFPDTFWGNVIALISHPIDYIVQIYRMVQNRILAIGQISQDKLDKIESICIHYNRNVAYNLIARNCQTFMKDVLDVIGLRFQPEGEFKIFMDRITSGQEETGKFQYMSTIFESRKDFDRYVDENWRVTRNEWDKKLLICYSDMMSDMYKKGEEKWGPINDESKWLQRIESVA